ncbi:putative ATP-dependent RNA helicase DHX57 [Saccostrea echinata]|uniref:putative ATP-dependent RNA helicase DHX57 n=1 Tax=Saccostrea echinata TaxID=191078 RepID=UPI002A80D562|nr:putative ATP-dependent RNA helicase DHX57 [Saccostrea echinata]
MDDRIVVRKKRGRPNRGGGRFNRGSSKNSRGRGSRRDDDRQYGDRGRVENDDKYRKKFAQTSPSFEKEVRVPMQRLQMTSENQDMVEDMLRDLRGEEIDTYSDEEYDELDDRYEDQYWLTDNTLYVEEAINYAAPERTGQKKTPVENVNRYAVNKLVRYGFEKQRCIEALQLLDGDIGSSLEYLHSKCFDLPFHADISNDDGDDSNDNGETEDKVFKSKEEKLQEAGVTWEEIEEQRKEEILALESIYADEFEVRIPNRLWMFRLELKNLVDIVMESGGGSKISEELEKEENSNICKFYQKGACRFGEKCKYKHCMEVASTKSETTEKEDKANFELELRFREDNVYPYEPPIIGFSSLVPGFPYPLCLNITEGLLKEAKELASNQSPASFSLIALLEDDLMIAQWIEKPPLAFSLPESESSIIPSLRHYNKLGSLKPSESYLAPKNFNDEYSENYEDEESEDLRITEAGNSKQTKGDNKIEVDVVEDRPVPLKRTFSRESDSNQLSEGELLKQNRRLKDEYKRKQGSKSLTSMISQRKRLPAWNKQEDILAALKNHQVLVISGMTGCGKTTQVPQFILDSYLRNEKSLKICNILCTQPRRISAMAVAERVAEERVDKLGRIVGYQIRLEKVQSSLTRLLFCTTGIVLRRLEGEPDLNGVSHIIIDEVHERSEESDFLMMYLRDMLPKRPDLKVILMSATLNAELFSEYFNGCPVIDIPGKAFPVQSFFLEDATELTGFVMEERSPYARPLKQMNAVRQGQSWQTYEEDLNTDPGKPPGERVKDENLTVKQLMYRYSEYKKSTCKALSMMDLDKINYDLIVDLLEWIVDGDHQYSKGAVLVFLPGFAEIQQLYEALTSHRVFGIRSGGRFKIIPLHSTLSSEDQHAVFLKPPEGVTKIVIATNIAETSITIDDITFVIDAGKMKEKRYDFSKGMESLDTVWVSRANALQRRGRAGRVTSGVCFHLFTSHRFDYDLQDQPIPEIQRAPLEQICLRIKMLDIFKTVNVQEVLEQLPEPPSEESIMAALKRLQDLGALDEDNELTPLGYHLGSLPVDVRIGKLMLFGAIFRCLDPALTIAATLSYKSPFVSPFDKRDEADKKKLEFAVGNSDHLTMLNAYKGWIESRLKSHNEGYRFCHENFLSYKSLQMLASMKQQFVELLSDIGFVKEGIVVRDVERAARGGSDGVVDVTGIEANINSANWKLVSAILVGALYPNVVQVMKPSNKFSQGSTGALYKAPKPDELKFRTKSDGFVHIHPSSVNFQVNHYESPYLVYHEKVKTTKVYIRDCTMVSMYPLLLFGGGSISVDLEKGNFVLSIDDGWIRFLADSPKVAELVRELRLELDQLLTDKIQNPHMDLCNCPKGSKIIDTIVKLISTQ